MDNIGICCNCCGRTTQGATYVNGMYFCAKCYQDTFGSKIVNVTIDNKSIPEINKEVNVNDLEQENKVLKKALELAVNCLQREIDGDYLRVTEVQAIYEIGEDYFIEQAKESMKDVQN